MFGHGLIKNSWMTDVTPTTPPKYLEGWRRTSPHPGESYATGHAINQELDNEQSVTKFR
ncbi:hypothetical protein J6590_090506 [Homalodisca vitripennis]|nr:hypothetical protein J6590_090506 [Homalodisca vitripennis]